MGECGGIVDPRLQEVHEETNFLYNLTEQDKEGVRELRLGLEVLAKVAMAVGEVNTSVANWRFSTYRLRAASRSEGEEEDVEDDGEDQEKRYGDDGSVTGEDEDLKEAGATVTPVEATTAVVDPDEEWELSVDPGRQPPIKE